MRRRSPDVSHMWMSLMNESYQWVISMSHINESYEWVIWMRADAASSLMHSYTLKKRKKSMMGCTYGWVTRMNESYVWMRHVTDMNESHVWMRHVTHMHETILAGADAASSLIPWYKWNKKMKKKMRYDESHVRMSHDVSHVWMSHVNENQHS